MTGHRRWTRREYERLIEHGLLHEDEPVELIGGQLMVSEPQGSLHAAGVSLVARARGRALGPGWYVMVQLPVAFDDESQPEPDVAVVPGDPRDYLHAHPSRADLVVEVADSSLDFDRRDKGGLYARAGVRDYWIADLTGGVLEVHRTPAPAPGRPFGWAFADVRRLGPERSVSPLAAPAVVLSIADLLP